MRKHIWVLVIFSLVSCSNDDFITLPHGVKDRTVLPAPEKTQTLTDATAPVSQTPPAVEPSPDPVAPSHPVVTKQAFILDTDMAGDVDDMGSLAMMHALADLGELNPIGVMFSTSGPHGAGAIDAVNTYYGRGYLPIGVLEDDNAIRNSSFSTKVALNFPHNTQTRAHAEGATKLYRKLLAAQADATVTIAVVGFLNNIENLLKSGADEISPLNGVDLVRAKVKQMVVMGGKFPDSGSYVETNFSRGYNAKPATAYVLQHFPNKMIFSGHEVGNSIHTGARLADTSPYNPVRCAYFIYFKGTYQHRRSWDQTAVLYAARGVSTYWKLSAPGYVHYNESTGTNSWVESSDKEHVFISALSRTVVAQVIEDLMIQPPKNPVLAPVQPNCSYP